MLAAGVRIPTGTNPNQIPICVVNLSDNPIKLYLEQAVAFSTIIPNESTVQLDTLSEQEKQNYDPVPDVQLGKDLAVNQTEQLKKLPREIDDVFDFPGNEDFTQTIEHKIKLTEPGSINCPPRRHNLGMIDEINKTVEEHVKDICSIILSLGFRNCLSKKPDGSIRLCCDFRPLNKIIETDSFPTGNINEVIDQLVGTQYFSCIDSAQGYLQVSFAKEDQPKTAFQSSNGLWEWTRMCYGLKGLSSTFCRLMRKISSHIPSHRLALYMDDRCVIFKTFSKHLENLQETFDALKKHGLRIKAVKCSFTMSEVTFLGHKTTRKAVVQGYSKVEAVQKWPLPANVRDLQRFLGTVGWYKRLIKNFSDISFPFYQMLQKGAKFIWSDDAQKTFEQLKQKLTEVPVLIHPDPKKI